LMKKSAHERQNVPSFFVSVRAECWIEFKIIANGMGSLIFGSQISKKKEKEKRKGPLRVKKLIFVQQGYLALNFVVHHCGPKKREKKKMS